RVQTGIDSVSNGVEVLGGNATYIAQAHAAILRIRGLGVVLPTIYSHVVAALNQPGPDLLHECLEPAISGRHSASSDERDSHLLSALGWRREQALPPQFLAAAVRQQFDRVFALL